MSAITHLTKDGAKSFCEVANTAIDLKNTYFNLQVIEVKKFSAQDNKKNIKVRLHLSDGVSYVIAIITNKLDKIMGGKDIPKYSVIRINGGSTTQNQVNNRKVMILKEPPEIIYTGINRTVGAPKEYTENKQNNSFNSHFDLKIPLHETDQKKVHQINNEYDDPNTFPDYFDELNSHVSPRAVGGYPNYHIKEETKSPSNINIVQHQQRNERERERSNNNNNGQTNSNSNNQQQGCPQGAKSVDLYTTIKFLNQFSTDWKIKARVTKKYPKREWSNLKGTGVLLNIELMDTEGTQIQATFFNEGVSKWDDLLQENQVYSFANGFIKLANQKFTSIKNDNCFTFDQNADILKVEDDKYIKHQGFSFVTVAQLQKLFQIQQVDVIGVVTQIGLVGSIIIKATGESKQKRNFVLADDSGLSVSATMWGKNGIGFNFSEGQVIAIKNARTSQYGGKSLNCSDHQSEIFVEPEHVRTIELQNWFEKGAAQEVKSISAERGGEDGKAEFRLIEEMNKANEIDYQLQSGQEPGQNFKLSGYVAKIFYDDQRQMYYLACPDCRKKMMEEFNQGFRCESCNKLQKKANLTYSFTAIIGDFTNTQMISFMGEQGDVIIGMSAQEFRELKKEATPDQIRDYLTHQQFKNYGFVTKAKLGIYNSGGVDERRLRYMTLRALPYDLIEENQMLLKRMALYAKKE